MLRNNQSDFLKERRKKRKKEKTWRKRDRAITASVSLELHFPPNSINTKYFCFLWSQWETKPSLIRQSGYAFLAISMIFFFFFLLVSLKTPFCKQSPLILLLPPSKMFKLLSRRLGARKYVSVCVWRRGMEGR